MEKLPYLTELHIYLTFKCNQSCTHCYTASGPDANPQVVDISIARNLIEYLTKSGLERVVLDGGEPLLAPEVINTLICVCRSIDVPIVIRTNGSMLVESPVFQDIVAYEKAFVEVGTGFYHADPIQLSDFVSRLGKLCERVTLIKYADMDSKDWTTAEKSLVNNSIQLKKAYVCRFGRASDLPYLREKFNLMDLPVCKGVGSKISLYPDGSLWGCAGYAIPELWKAGNTESPLYWGMLTHDRIDECIERGRRRLSLCTLRVAGHFGIQALCPEKEGCNEDMTFAHICEACRIMIKNEQCLDRLGTDETINITKQLAEAWEMRQLLHNVP